MLFLGNALTLVLGVDDLRTCLPWLPALISSQDLAISLFSAAGVTVLALLTVADAPAVALENPPPGIYFYDERAPVMTRTIKPPARVKLEITDLRMRDRYSP
jgi:hypothetical protein